MSVSQSSPLVVPETVAVAPTETTVLSLTRDILKGAKRVTAQVSNLDATQVVYGIVYRRKTGMTSWAPSTMPDFASIGALASVMADIDVEGTDELEIRFTASGAGCDVQVGATRKAATP